MQTSNKASQGKGSTEKIQANPRKLALLAIDKIEKGGYSNIIISDILNKNELMDKDRALFSVMVKGVVERKITLDYVISTLSSMPISKLDDDALHILRLGLYQLIYMDSVPRYAAVNECVDLSRKRSKGFVNALLRTFIRNDCKFDLPKDNIKRLSVEYSVPLPLLKRFISIYGEERTKNILEGFLQKKYTDICVDPLVITRDELVKKLKSFGYHAEMGKLSPLCVKTDAPYFFLDENFKGAFLAMDEASQLCGVTVGAVSGERVLDTCSAPGSKSYVAAFCMQNNGSILSCDLHASKLSLIKDGAKRLGIDIIETKVADGREYSPECDSAFDRVLCDVPCSGIGVIGGKPEIKYKNIDEFKALPKIQYDILCNSAKYVKDGGYLIYSTCTLLPEENEENIRKFLAENQDFSLEAFQVGDETCEGMITLTPDINGTDGFFIAKMKKMITKQ